MAAVASAVTVAAACTATTAKAAVLSVASSSSEPAYDEARGGATALPSSPSHECAVCLSELPAGAEPQPAVRALPACGHAFHADCIGRWLLLRPECPLCRRPVLLADGQQHLAAIPAAAPAWARPATTIACGFAFGDGRVVWTRSPSASASARQ